MGNDLPKKALAPTVQSTGGAFFDDFLKASDYTALCESIETKAYQDSGGVWTIGIGAIKFENGTPVKEGDTITTDEALRLFDRQFKTYWDRCANEIPGWDAMHSGQRAALASLSFNTGYRYRDGGHDSLDAQIEVKQPLTALLKYNKVFSDEYPDGKPELGLSRRRYGEYLMSQDKNLSAKDARTLAWGMNTIAEIENAVLR